MADILGMVPKQPMVVKPPKQPRVTRMPLLDDARIEAEKRRSLEQQKLRRGREATLLTEEGKTTGAPTYTGTVLGT